MHTFFRRKKDTTKELHSALLNAEFILVIRDDKVKVLKNRNLIKRKALISKLEEL